MNAVLDPALELALACHRRPALLAGVCSRPLPDDLRVLLRLAAGDEALVAQCAASHRQTPAEVVEAAVFFIQQVLFTPDADSYRVLGVRPDAADTLIKEHYRWLVRWQHPDRARDWDSVYANRINSAWQDLRLPERRRAYDETSARRVSGVTPAGVHRLVPVASGAWHEPVDELHRPAWFGRHLPALVLGVLALFAVALLGLMWHARQPRHRADLAVATAPAPVMDVPDAIVVAGETAQADRASTPAVFGSALPDVPAENSVPSPLAGAPLSVAAVPLSAPIPEPVLAREPPPPELRHVPATVLAPERLRASTPPRVAVASAAESEDRVAAAAQSPIVTPQTASAPQVLPAPAPTTSPVWVPITQADAEDVMRQFRAAYSSGDLPALMRLFTADAHNNRGDRTAIASDYRNLFSTTQKRELELQPAGWIERGDERTLIARYRSKVKREGNWTSSRVEGLIRIDLRRDDGELKISRMIHDEDS